MPDIAIGRKEILEVLHILSWRTVQKWKKKDPGFAKLIRHHPVTGTPFVVKDVCAILELNNVTMAIESLDEDEKLISTLLMSGQNRQIWTVSEPGLYTLIFRSNKPAAKTFRRWITHEVLPTLRKTGKYSLARQENEPNSPPPPPADIPADVWRQVRTAGRNIRQPYRIKLLNLACQLSRIDATASPTRASILLDYADLCRNIGISGDALIVDTEDGIDDFLESCCTLDSAARIQASVLYDSFAAWHREANGEEAPTMTWFGRRMTLRFEKRKSEGIFYYCGLELRPRKTTLQSGERRVAL
ncbi:MAG: hypothetical protein A4E66_00149 [Syntrophus sp. PtaB.Bin001]|nr:MAG: hypothetical protein A4E66_00149 [Syntrophus sp. PtaB.Bin001]